jgi:hypothetical protein
MSSVKVATCAGSGTVAPAAGGIGAISWPAAASAAENICLSVLHALQVFLLHVSPELRRSYESMLLNQIEQVRRLSHAV